ncbi:MAG TPA: hypothetical protein VE990_16115 [Acidimicrobiales bacterium]|nr:hypothetical protein [Acidimicrobiales bacterium]
MTLVGELSQDDEVVAPDHFYPEAEAALRRRELHGDPSTERAAWLSGARLP